MPDPDYPFEESPPEEEEGASPGAVGTVGFLADVVRKTVLTGMGALFLTEEGARKLAREWKLPKELSGFLVQQAHGAKDEVLRVVGQEIPAVLRVRDLPPGAPEAAGGDVGRGAGGDPPQGSAGARQDPSSREAPPPRSDPG